METDYDGLDRPRRVTRVVRDPNRPDQPGLARRLTTFTNYDSRGNPTWTREPSGAVTSRVFNAADELLSETLPPEEGAGQATTTHSG